MPWPKSHGRRGVENSAEEKVGASRIGQHRVIYEIDDAKEEATVLDVGHRRDVYR